MTGTLEQPTQVKVHNRSVFVTLANGKGDVLVDESDWPLVGGYSWCVGRGYAIRTDRSGGTQRTVSMHRQIMGDIPADHFVDHVNRNKLDNRRSNLRLVQKSLNAFNTGSVRPDNHAGVRGVSRHHGGWVVRISKDGRTHWRGKFADIRSAIERRAEVEIEFFGELSQPTIDALARFA